MSSLIIHTDASYYKETGMSGMAVTITNKETGLFMTLCERGECVNNSEAELVALRMALRFLNELPSDRHYKVSIIGDCLPVVNGVKGLNGLRFNKRLYADTRYLYNKIMASTHIELKLEWKKRVHNKVADRDAKAVLKSINCVG